MNLRMDQAGPCRREVHVEIPAAEVSKEFAELTAEYTRYAALPGFRAGRAPKELVRRRYLKDITEEVRKRLVSQGYQEAVKQHKLEAVSILDVKEAQAKDGEDFKFSFVLDVAPDFELPTYKGIALSSKKNPVTDADIDAVVANMREQNAKYNEASGRPVKAGDMVQVDFEGLCEGKPFQDISEKAATLGQAKDFWAIADEENSFLPGFGSALQGANVGDKLEVTVVFPADFIEKSVAGKTAKYSVHVKGLREKHVPEIDAEFLETLGVKTREELNERVRKDMGEMREGNERQRLQNEIVAWLLKNTRLDVPDSELQRERQDVVYDIVRDATSRKVARDEIESKREEIFGAATQQAAERIKARYILRRIAENEKLSATEDEINNRIAMLAHRYRMPTDRFEKELEKNNGFGQIVDEVRIMKTLSWLVDAAKIAEE